MQMEAPRSQRPSLLLGCMSLRFVLLGAVPCDTDFVKTANLEHVLLFYPHEIMVHDGV